MAAKKKKARRSAPSAKRNSPGLDVREKAAIQLEPQRDNNPASLDPDFKARLTRALQDLEARGTPFRFIEGFRTVERQQWLFGQGRPEAKPFGRAGKVITQRDGVTKMSNHQGTGKAGSGKAADCYPVRNGKVFIPDASDPVWDAYADAVERQGLSAGHRWKSFKDSPHAELLVVAPAQTRQFVRSVKVPKVTRKRAAVRRRRGTTDEIALPTAAPALEEKTAQALVAGAGLIMAEQGIAAQLKEDIVNSTLLAQFAASSAVADSTDVIAWYNEYFNALQQLGWVMTSRNFQEFQQSGKSFQVHKAIMSVLSVALGPAATTLAVVKSVLEGLEEVGSDKGWLTLFDREAVSAKVAKFQLVTAQPAAGGLVDIGLFAFSVEAKKKVTQVLFFKFKKSDAKLRHAGGTASISEQLLASVRDALKTKLENIARDFVASIPIPRR